MGLLATKLACSIEPGSMLIGIGTSGAVFARRIDANSRSLTMETVSFSASREERLLKAEQLCVDEKLVMVDDIVVSGQTLRVAADAIAPRPVQAAVGMLFKSKRALRRADVGIDAALVYCRREGGSPPINSVSTLSDRPERLEELCGKYFPLGQLEILRILNEDRT